MSREEMANRYEQMREELCRMLAEEGGKHYLDNGPETDTGRALREEKDRISAAVDEKLNAGNLDEETLGQYEAAVFREGFYAGVYCGFCQSEKGRI